MGSHLVTLPVELIYELGIAPAVRLAASDLELDERSVDRTVAACWRAVSADWRFGTRLGWTRPH